MPGPVCLVLIGFTPKQHATFALTTPNTPNLSRFQGTRPGTRTDPESTNLRRTFTQGSDAGRSQRASCARVSGMPVSGIADPNTRETPGSGDSSTARRVPLPSRLGNPYRMGSMDRIRPWRDGIGVSGGSAGDRPPVEGRDDPARGGSSVGLAGSGVWVGGSPKKPRGPARCRASVNRSVRECGRGLSDGGGEPPGHPGRSERPRREPGQRARRRT